MGSILDELEQTAIKSNKKRKRRDDGNGDDNNDEETDSHLLHADDIADAAKRRARFDEIMEKGNVQSEAAFKPLIKEETKAANTLDDEVEPDDNFLNEALAKARRLRKLRELSTPRVRMLLRRRFWTAMQLQIIQRRRRMRVASTLQSTRRSSSQEC
ncbi:SART-1 family protein [Fragilaria crotonensis]|nr:SART-1 family protein [Fragilaria crotonensis]